MSAFDPEPDMGQYNAAFAVGTKIRIRERTALEAFRRDWKYHHPLETEQIAFAGAVATVKGVGYYHGGDPLYTFQDVPGTWHEACLEQI